VTPEPTQAYGAAGVPLPTCATVHVHTRTRATHQIDSIWVAVHVAMLRRVGIVVVTPLLGWCVMDGWMGTSDLHCTAAANARPPGRVRGVKASGGLCSACRSIPYGPARAGYM
jgi:hypothetical protein